MANVKTAVGLDMARMDLWRPGGRTWRVEITIENPDPAEIAKKIDYFKEQFLKEDSKIDEWRKA